MNSISQNAPVCAPVSGIVLQKSPQRHREVMSKRRWLRMSCGSSVASDIAGVSSLPAPPESWPTESARSVAYGTIKGEKVSCWAAPIAKPSKMADGFFCVPLCAGKGQGDCVWWNSIVVTRCACAQRPWKLWWNATPLRWVQLAHQVRHQWSV